METVLAFGRTGIKAKLPDGFHYRHLEARSAQALPDWQKALEAALDAPIGTPPLSELASGKKSAAISVCDITRPAPNSKVLPPVLRRLLEAGVPRENVTILIATGLHRPATPDEIREICGEEIAGSFRIVNHMARDLASHRYLGTAPAGTPVYVDERFVSADLHLTLGFIEPHLMLGYSGGRKLIAPGLAAQETIKVLHSSKFMRDPRAVEGCIEGNPLHQELLGISRMARHDFIVDVALARDRSIAAIFAGHPEDAHRCGVRFVSETMLETLAEPVDAVITTAAGYPLDLTYYQSIKGVTAASHIVKPGGHILLMAACEEGVGAEEFRRMLLAGESEPQFLERIDGAPVTVDQWQIEKLAMVTGRNRVSWFVPGVPAEYREKLWGRCYLTAQAALDGLAAELAPGSTVAVIPEGPYVLAKAASLSV